jgi:hypothetical protein
MVSRVPQGWKPELAVVCVAGFVTLYKIGVWAVATYHP